MQTIRDELKGAIDAPATARGTPAETVSEATAQGRGEVDDPPAPAEPLITLPLPSVPPVVDPRSRSGPPWTRRRRRAGPRLRMRRPGKRARRRR